MLNGIFWSGMKELAQWRGREGACVALLLLSASCVPLQAAEAPAVADALRETPLPDAPAAADPLPEPEPMVLREVPQADAPALNAAIPLSEAANPRARSTVFRGASFEERQRALQCLAEAVWYEARSESEEGQRAVAQVVLNRVRHPAYPGSVCGVVYQGPMRAGGGCQFTFTCDGSLASPPGGWTWLRARRIAADALSGAVAASVGHATHYHTHQVLPDWAYRLAKVAVIGSHNFYRMPGAWGGPAAFRQAYSGREPAPSAVIAARLPVTLRRAAAATAPALSYVPPPLAGSPAAPALATRELPVPDNLPRSRVRPEFESSGRWKDGAL